MTRVKVLFKDVSFANKSHLVKCYLGRLLIKVWKWSMKYGHGDCFGRIFFFFFFFFFFLFYFIFFFCNIGSAYPNNAPFTIWVTSKELSWCSLSIQALPRKTHGSSTFCSMPYCIFAMPLSMRHCARFVARRPFTCLSFQFNYTIETRHCHRGNEIHVCIFFQ